MGELKFRQSKKGQTYVEVIAAIGLVSMALLVMVRLKTAQLKLGEQTANKTVAFNLTVEGLEIAESLRLDHRMKKIPKPYNWGLSKNCSNRLWKN